MRSVSQVMSRFNVRSLELDAPEYVTGSPTGIALAVEDMSRHMADAGWQIMLGLQHAGYPLWGYSLPPNDETDVGKILQQSYPGVVVMQDKREWDVPQGNFREPKARFNNVGELAKHPDIFKVTILKDAHQRPRYHRQSAEEMGVHAWVIYYHSDIVKRVAPYVRSQHLIRTYHSINTDDLPKRPYHERLDCLLSGAVSVHYPLRRWFARHRNDLWNTRYTQHPGYHNRGCVTPAFLQKLSKHKVAICTSSMYGYSLRKHIEATACGCRVVTDLPVEDVLPEIDGNLHRINSNPSLKGINQLLEHLCETYDSGQQQAMALRARGFYDYRAVGRRLVSDIETLRSSYNG